MGELQIKEITNLINSMNREEQKIVIAALPSSMLWDELKERDSIRERIIAGVKGLVSEK